MQTTAVTQTDIRDLAALLTGCFDNAAQATAAADSEFTLVRYENCPVTIADRAPDDASEYIFAEQIADTPAVQFARRRIMQVRPSSDKQCLEIAFYTLAAEERWAGSGKGGAALDLTRQDLGSYECSLFYRRAGDRFVGGTPAGGQPHTYRGAVKLVIAAELSPEELAVWERWYDASGQQVAGPVSGPYRYIRSVNQHDSVDVSQRECL